MLRINKKFYKFSISSITDRLNLRLIEFELSIPDIKNTNVIYTNKTIKFEPSKNSIRAINLLNENDNLFNKCQLPNNELLFPYRIYMSLLNKHDLVRLNDNVFYNKCCFLFQEKRLGDIILESAKNFDFSQNNLSKVCKLLEHNLKVLNPSYFSNKCVTTGLMIFILKDALEYSGMINDFKSYSNLLLSLNRFKYSLLKKDLFKAQEFACKYGE